MPQPAGLERLPGEILLHIISYLEPVYITNLQLVSRAFRNLGRDNSFWRSQCLQESSYIEILGRVRSLRLPSTTSTHDPDLAQIRPTDSVIRALRGENSNSPSNGGGGSYNDSPVTEPPLPVSLKTLERERTRIMANWDPGFPGEKISWYEEYIQRHAPIAVNWLALPRRRRDYDSDQMIVEDDYIEARGLALYRPDGHREVGGGNPFVQAAETLLAVSPLDDGSVCLWDVNGTREDTGRRRGAIVAKSRPGILFVDGSGSDSHLRSKRVDSGVTECVSVDSWHHRAFFAVQSRLIEVDLQRLSIVGCEPFPWSITALSSAHPSVPLTVGTNQGIHLHDYRSRSNKTRLFHGNNGPQDSIDDFDRMGADEFFRRSLKHIFDDEPLAPYAPLAQPGPLSILHLQRPGMEADLSDDIYVAGRFSSILHYDRRKFPSIRGSIHSGARLCSLASLPYPFSSVDSDLRRQGQLSIEQVERSKNLSGGRCLIAAGEYNTKGSLELYGLLSPSLANTRSAGGLQNAVFHNRQTSSDSKLLSVVNHGARIAFSDGSGCVKWFERDGFTEVRRCIIGHSETSQGPSVFASMPGSDDIARKLLPTRASASGPGAEGSVGSINNNDLLFWTGEKLGLLTFSSRPGFRSEEFEERINELSEEAKERAREEKDYAERMRRALQMQADDVRFVGDLGLGSGRRQN